MNILAHHHFNGELQRSEVEQDGFKFVRVAGTFSPVDGNLRQRSPALWLSNDSRSLPCLLKEAKAKDLERFFIDELIRLNTPPLPGVAGTLGPQGEPEPIQAAAPEPEELTGGGTPPVDPDDDIPF